MNYHNILHGDMLNGDGFRTVLFVSGCSLHCKNCHNPQTWDKDSGIPFDESAKDEIFKSLENEIISGLTLTGGHPLEEYNLETLTNLCKEVKLKFPNKTIWIYTGLLFEDVKNLEILKYTDVLVDGAYIESQQDTSLKWRGSKNQRVINVPKSLIGDNIFLHCD